MKILFLIITVSLLALVGAAYACEYNFCSNIACGCGNDCIDTCDGGYWYSNGVCNDCFYSDSKHCGYETRTCADADPSDDVPNINGCVKTCSAQCDQDSDCSCQDSGCVGSDYYDYIGTCDKGCVCNCKPVITIEDSRCIACDPNNVNCTDPICYSNPTCAACDKNNFDCNNPACDNNILCLPCDENNANCTLPSCFNNPACLACDNATVNCGNPACLNSPLCFPCDLNNVNCSIAACSSNVACLPCDKNSVNCSIPACANNSACLPQPTASPQGGGAFIVAGGYTAPKATAKPAVCGDNDCYAEDCSSCPKDCLKQGQICCSGIAYNGNCCVDYDCGDDNTCDITKHCQPHPVKINATCQENWTCTDWSECNGVAQIRKCLDANKCNSTEQAPNMVERCTLPSPTGMFLLGDPTLLGSILTAFILLILLVLRRRNTLAPKT